MSALDRLESFHSKFPELYQPLDLAFYLPHHHFRPFWWGVYLTYEGVTLLGDYLFAHAGGTLTKSEARLAAQRFLYYHEAWHHNVESFAFRLEASHHERLYVLGFDRHYELTLKQDKCWEEGVANAYAYFHAPRHKSFSAAAKPAIRAALTDFTRANPPTTRSLSAFSKTPIGRATRINYPLTSTASASRSIRSRSVPFP